MKNLKVIMVAVAATFLAACSQSGQKAEQKVEEEAQRTLVVYFSATGTTKAVAEKIAAATGGDLLEIEPVQPYTDADLNWRDSTSRTTIEMHDLQFRPEMKSPVTDAADYDVIYLGFPIWWDLAPTIVNTYLDAAALDGKTVVPFATSGGSPIDNSAKELKKLYPDIDWQEGRLLNDATDESVAEWVGSLAL